MNIRIGLAVVSAVGLFGQDSTMIARPMTSNPTPSIVVTGNGQIEDIGLLDTGQRVKVLFPIKNTNLQNTYSLWMGKGLGRIMAMVGPVTSVLPGAFLDVPFTLDGHGLDGPQELVLELRTGDPGAPILQKTIAVTFVSSTKVSPYRDAVMATQDINGLPVGVPMRFEFQAGLNSGPFVSVQLEDLTAPLIIAYEKTNLGGVVGTVSIDQTAILNGARKEGETRILGETARGNQNFIVVQWLILPAK